MTCYISFWHSRQDNRTFVEVKREAISRVEVYDEEIPNLHCHVTESIRSSVPPVPDVQQWKKEIREEVTREVKEYIADLSTPF